MNRKRLFLYQAVGWTLLIGYDLLSIWLTGKPKLGLGKSLLLQLTFWLSFMSLFYYCYLFVFPQGVQRGRWLVVVLGVLGTPVVFAGTRYLLEELLLPLLFGFRNYTPGTSLLYYLKDNLYFLAPTVVLAGAAVGVRDTLLREKERENRVALQALQQEKRQAELAFLRTQINPHFLYNTLNYLYAEAYLVSEPLAEAVLRLSDLMRYMLHESPDGRIDLEKEVDYVHNFLAIHQLRFEDKFFVQFRQTGAAVAGQRVASLLLIPFVENALKHGVVNRADQPVEISLHLPAPDQLLFEVHNFINQHQKDATTGIGLANIRRRLELLYPNRHNLQIEDDGRQHRIRLTVAL
ncbi:histidine kinase [Hymenobacter sp. NBH84]|uniref:sensor histidine kinase n=1 Tax=Hymenobacter sp. NBH84 TaxID=2596915 RepID=UPI001624AE29|nr:histidine kinase [Hymenobacter sp. NBH84]QNE40934.1 histidine kinase [Hymenobacter sp. NBH84]